ncbi:MAG: hypothetical protein RQ751_01460 [Longimicrobiales bacterium]|nr:hypothetical protein [Longimicrobiales bacterium]
MSRRILDADFRTWEPFVNTGPSGFSRPPRLVFRCVSDPSLPSRMTGFSGEPEAALTLVETGAEAELVRLLEEGAPIS